LRAGGEYPGFLRDWQLYREATGRGIAVLVIDFNNLRFAAAARGRDLELPSLRQIIDLSRFAPRGAIVVCDGVARRSALSEDLSNESTDAAWRIVFAGPRSDADSVIERFLSEESAPRRLTVVSTDRRVRAAASRRGAESLTSERFLEMLGRDAAAARGRKRAGRTESPLSEPEVQEWLRVFASSVEEKRAEPAPPAADGLKGVDAALREAIERGELNAADLDMARWLKSTGDPSGERG